MHFRFVAVGVSSVAFAGFVLAGPTLANHNFLMGTVAAVVAQDEATETATTPERRQERLRRDLGFLARMEPHLDAQLRESLPTLRTILERYNLTPEISTQTDRDITRMIRKVGLGLSSRGGLDPLEGIVPIKKKVTEAARVRPEIDTAERSVPTPRPKRNQSTTKIKASGGKVGVVMLRINGHEKTIVEVPTTAGNLSPGARARQISLRIQQAMKRDPLWYLSAKPGTVNGNDVVLVPKAPGGYIVTADPGFARLRQTTPAELAARIASDIRTTVDRPSFLSMPRGSEKDRAAEAIDFRVQGDAAYDRGDVAAAERLYQKGLKENPGYGVLYERLAGIYSEQGRYDKTAATAKAALALPDLDVEQKALFQQILADGK